MKRMIILIACLFSLAGWGYNSLPMAIGSLQSEIEDLKIEVEQAQQQQDCLLRQQREQDNYINCLRACKELNLMNKNDTGSLCICPWPLSGSCY